MWIELTDQTDGVPTWVNLNMLTFIFFTARDGARKATAVVDTAGGTTIRTDIKDEIKKLQKWLDSQDKL